MYSFYLDNVLLPITPDGIHVKIKNKNKVVEMINYGEVTVLSFPGLTDISFDFVIPVKNKYPFVRDVQSPEFYLSTLEKLKTSLKPFKLVVLRQISNEKSELSTNMNVTLEDYEIIEEAEKGLDITVKVNLKQYREYGTQNIILEQNKDGTVTTTKKTPRETTKEPAKTYTVQKGDTLWNIAKKQLGDGSKYKDLAKINNIANPNILSVGTVLKLS